MAEFNLLDEPWIPCMDLEDQQMEFGIRDLFRNAHEIREIYDDSPLVTVSIHRLLLAILYRAFQGPTMMREWKTLFNLGLFSVTGELGNYLNKWHDCFFLFDEMDPFMQIAGLNLHGKSDSILTLAREAPDKKGRILFDHRMGVEHLEQEPKQIAKLLIAAQSYSGTGIAAGGKINEEAIFPAPRRFGPCIEGLCLYIQGNTLFKTLMLNLVPFEISPNDLPAWEDPQIVQLAKDSWYKPLAFSGRVQLFAPLSRFFKVIDNRNVLVTNGFKGNSTLGDPMKAYVHADENNEYKAVELKVDKAVWRNIYSLFLKDSEVNQSPACLNHIAQLNRDGDYALTKTLTANIIGLARDQGRIYLWRHEQIPISLALIANNNLSGRLGILLQNAEQAAIELDNRIYRVVKLYLFPTAESSDGAQPDIEMINSFMQSVDPLPVYWSCLEQHFYKLLTELNDDWDDLNEAWKPEDQQIASNNWRKQVKQEARSALIDCMRSLGTTARALQAVAHISPVFDDSDLDTKSPSDKKQLRGHKDESQ